MRDHWNELARRVREAQPAAPPAMNPGFDQAVLRRLAQAQREPQPLFEAWVPLLRPALGLALATAVICLAVEFGVRTEPEENILSQTEQLIQLAVLK